MDRADLLQLSHEALIDLVLQLQETAGAAGRQQALIEQLTARVAELEAEVARLGGPPKTSGNSSVPPSQGREPNGVERRGRERSWVTSSAPEGNAIGVTSGSPVG